MISQAAWGGLAAVVIEIAPRHLITGPNTATAHNFDGMSDPDTADEVAASLGVLLDAVGVNPKGDPVAALDKL